MAAWIARCKPPSVVSPGTRSRRQTGGFVSRSVTFRLTTFRLTSLFGWICQRSRRTCRREVNAEFFLRRLENGERTGGATEVNEATMAGGNMLVVAGVGAEEVTEFVVASTEALRGGEALEAAHTSCAAFHAPVVL